MPTLDLFPQLPHPQPATTAPPHPVRHRPHRSRPRFRHHDDTLFTLGHFPTVLSDALTCLRAPDWVSGMDEVAQWAERALVFPVLCGGDGVQVSERGGTRTYTMPTRGRIRHLVRVDPHTLTTTASTTTDADKKRVTDVHFLWAMSVGVEPQCASAGALLEQRVGGAEHLGEFPWGAGMVRRVLAVRTVARAVQYHALGLDVWRYGRWIGLGVAPEAVLVAEQELPALAPSPDDMVAFLERRVADDVWARQKDVAPLLRMFAREPSNA